MENDSLKCKKGEHFAFYIVILHFDFYTLHFSAVFHRDNLNIKWLVVSRHQLLVYSQIRLHLLYPPKSFR